MRFLKTLALTALVPLCASTFADPTYTAGQVLAYQFVTDIGFAKPPQGCQVVIPELVDGQNSSVIADPHFNLTLRLIDADGNVGQAQIHGEDVVATNSWNGNFGPEKNYSFRDQDQHSVSMNLQIQTGQMISITIDGVSCPHEPFHGH